MLPTGIRQFGIRARRPVRLVWPVRPVWLVWLVWLVRRHAGVLASALLAFPLAAGSAANGTHPVNATAPAPPPMPSWAAPADLGGPLGATGTIPQEPAPSPQLLQEAGNPAALRAGQRANLPNGPLGIPGIVLDAYLRAQRIMATEAPNCHLPWWLLAGIGKVESGQAENGAVDSAGNTLRPILGPRLDGTNGTAAIPSTDGGRWTGDPVWSRAVGPMQFLPSTWVEYGGSGNPNNVYDAAVAAGRYLCAGGRDLSVPAQRAAAVFSYNHSDSYVQTVLIWAYAYEQGVTPVATVPPTLAADALAAGAVTNTASGVIVSTTPPPPGSSVTTVPSTPQPSTSVPPTSSSVPPKPTSSSPPPTTTTSSTPPTTTTSTPPTTTSTAPPPPTTSSSTPPPPPTTT